MTAIADSSLYKVGLHIRVIIHNFLVPFHTLCNLCFQSHLFLVRMVNVASVTSIIRGLLGRRLLHVEYCCNKSMTVLLYT